MSIITLRSLSTEELLARLILGEARNQPLRGMVAVGCVVMNRFNDGFKRYGATVFNVITRKWQFSCFNEKDPNLPKLLSNPGKPIGICRTISSLIFEGIINDPTGGATHYHTKNCDPAWNDNPSRMFYLCTIGDHKFYREL